MHTGSRRIPGESAPERCREHPLKNVPCTLALTRAADAMCICALCNHGNSY